MNKQKKAIKNVGHVDRMRRRLRRGGFDIKQSRHQNVLLLVPAVKIFDNLQNGSAAVSPRRPADLISPVEPDHPAMDGDQTSSMMSPPAAELLADEAQVVGRFEVRNPVVEETNAVRLAKVIQFVEPDRPLT